jgi:hypothetical protein
MAAKATNAVMLCLSMRMLCVLRGAAADSHAVTADGQAEGTCRAPPGVSWAHGALALLFYIIIDRVLVAIFKQECQKSIGSECGNPVRLVLRLADMRGGFGVSCTFPQKVMSNGTAAG